MISFGDRVAIVTGAGRGLGRAEALELGRRGAAVVTNDIAGADDTARWITSEGGHALAHCGDVSDWRVAEALVESAVGHFGDLHVLVNNAGIVRDRMSFRMSEAEWDNVVRVNLKGCFAPARFAAAYWRRQWKQGVRGRWSIINTTSESGLFGNIGQANYAAAKAGVAALTVVLAGELARYGVTVNAIAPRARTAMSELAFGALPKTAAHDPLAGEHVARIVAWLASDLTAEVSGHVFAVYGGNVDVMAGWRVARHTAQPGGWGDDVLGDLRRELFTHIPTRRRPADVRQLFAATAPLPDTEIQAQDTGGTA